MGSRRRSLPSLLPSFPPSFPSLREPRPGGALRAGGPVLAGPGLRGAGVGSGWSPRGSGGPSPIPAGLWFLQGIAWTPLPSLSREVLEKGVLSCLPPGLPRGPETLPTPQPPGTNKRAAGGWGVVARTPEETSQHHQKDHGGAGPFPGWGFARGCPPRSSLAEG